MNDKKWDSSTFWTRLMFSLFGTSQGFKEDQAKVRELLNLKETRDQNLTSRLSRGTWPEEDNAQRIHCALKEIGVPLSMIEWVWAGKGFAPPFDDDYHPPSHQQSKPKTYPGQTNGPPGPHKRSKLPRP